jgi:RHS repeat-associated protein
VWTYGETDAPETLKTAGHVLRFRHDHGGRQTRRDVDETVVLTQSFDIEHRLASQAVAAGKGRIVQQRRFDYRQDGLLTGRYDAVSGSVRLGLDTAGRITEVISPGGRESYRYDAAGNIAASELGPRQYHGNTLVSAGALSFQYDAQGRAVRRRQVSPTAGEKIWLYSWDSHDRLIGVRTPDGTRWRYLYDPIGRRIAKQRLAPQSGDAEPVVAEQVEFFWDGPLLIEQVHTDSEGRSQVTTWDYHPIDDRPLTQVDSDGRFHSIVTDLVGTPTELVDANGVLAWHNRSGLWGESADAAGTSTPLRFPGQYADPESGLHYNVYRYYDPAVGRYLSQDPLGLGPAPNPVAYAANPYQDADPLGLVCKNGEGSSAPNRPGSGTDPAAAKKTPPPIPAKPPELKAPTVPPKPQVPDKAPLRNGTKTFGKDTAAGEKYELSADGTKVKIYRFGDQKQEWDWESRNRQDSNGNFAEPSDLNSWAIKQSSFGSGSENPTKNPFISIATDHESLSHSSDPWVQKIVKESPDLRVMEVPPEMLVRPRPTKPLSKTETEWLFYDGDNSMGQFHSEWVPNPYKK